MVIDILPTKSETAFTKLITLWTFNHEALRLFLAYNLRCLSTNTLHFKKYVCKSNSVR